MSETYLQVCCACQQKTRSRNIVMLDEKALTPGKGWGCVQCGLSQDGAIAAICDACAEKGDPEIRFVFDGYISDGKMIPIGELPHIPHVHNLELHPEVQR